MIMKPEKTCLLIAVIFAFPLISAQQNMIGGSAAYNLHTKSFGLGIRGKIPLRQIDFLEGISIVPQVSYFPGFNPVHEFYAGAGVQLDAYKIERWTFYGLTNFSYNGWMNHEDTEYRNGNFSNVGLEAGIGVSRKLFSCLHPFFEFRYNVRWSEFNLGLGMLYTIKCDRRGAVKCPKIPPPPQF